MSLFGKKKEDKEEEKPEENETEEQSDAVQTYVMEPSLQETHDLMHAVLGEVEQVVMGKRPGSRSLCSGYPSWRKYSVRG